MFQLQDISLELPDGYIMGLIGENGAGKTTLLHIICGLFSMDQGAIQWNGMNYTSDETAIKQDIGTVIHGDIFDCYDTLLKNANRYGRFYQNYDESLFKQYAAEFDLNIKKKYHQLSKGEKLKFSTAFALSHQPKLLLLDEPTANLDRNFRKTFFHLLREYTSNGKNSVILSTHMTSDIDTAADYLLFLKAGKQLLFGDIESVRKNYRMVAGEKYKIHLLKDKVIFTETTEFGSKALVRNIRLHSDPSLKIWEPSVEELMYYMEKGDETI